MGQETKMMNVKESYLPVYVGRASLGDIY